MKQLGHLLVCTCFALSVIFGGSGLALTQDYPNKPITLIVPFPPGGSTTVVGRIIADKIGDVLGQQVVVDNRGGAAERSARVKHHEARLTGTRFSRI